MSEFHDYLMTGRIDENSMAQQSMLQQLDRTIDQAMNIVHQMYPMGQVSPDAPVTMEILHHLAQASTLIKKL